MKRGIYTSDSAWIVISRFQEFVHTCFQANPIWDMGISGIQPTLTRQVKAAAKSLCISSALAGIRLLEYHHRPKPRA